MLLCFLYSPLCSKSYTHLLIKKKWYFMMKLKNTHWTVIIIYLFDSHTTNFIKNLAIRSERYIVNVNFLLFNISSIEWWKISKMEAYKFHIVISFSLKRKVDFVYFHLSLFQNYLCREKEICFTNTMVLLHIEVTNVLENTFYDKRCTCVLPPSWRYFNWIDLIDITTLPNFFLHLLFDI